MILPNQVQKEAPTSGAAKTLEHLKMRNYAKDIAMAATIRPDSNNTYLGRSDTVGMPHHRCCGTG